MTEPTQTPEEQETSSQSPEAEIDEAAQASEEEGVESEEYEDEADGDEDDDDDTEEDEESDDDQDIKIELDFDFDFDFDYDFNLNIDELNLGGFQIFGKDKTKVTPSFEEQLSLKASTELQPASSTDHVSQKDSLFGQMATQVLPYAVVAYCILRFLPYRKFCRLNTNTEDEGSENTGTEF